MCVWNLHVVNIVISAWKLTVEIFFQSNSIE